MEDAADAEISTKRCVPIIAGYVGAGVDNFYNTEELTKPQYESSVMMA